MLSPGVQLNGRYRLDERIAGGGMGDVWRGTDEVLGRTVAVKVLLPALLDEPGFAERFRGEARTMANINHPGVVDVYDYGTDGGTPYLVMEYVEGDALATTLGRVGRLTPARTMALLAQAADALQAAHEKGIVHRDVKPGNLLVRPNGTLVLTDFGIARSAMLGQLTQTGSVLGTASYISPEQAAGGVATPASDVYALGVVAYQCLAGRRPFEGDGPLEIAMKHVRDAPPPLPADTPPAVRAIVERAMAKDPPARWASAAQLATVARQAATSAGTPTTAGSLAGAPQRRVAASPAPARIPARAPGGRAAPAPPAARPISPPAGKPAAPAGTRFMPPQPAGQQPYLRGAAAVSPGPTRQQTRPYAAPAAPATPRQPGSRNGWLILLAVVLALVVVVCSGVIAYRLANQANDNAGGNGSRGGSGGAATDTTATDTTGPDTGGAAAARDYAIPCDQYRLQKFEKVKADLEAADYEVVRRDVPGLGRGRVVDVAPCQAPKGTAVTVQVATGKRDPRSCRAVINDPINCQQDRNE
jgi:serine/threonine-protein kinase